MSASDSASAPFTMVIVPPAGKPLTAESVNTALKIANIASAVINEDATEMVVTLSVDVSARDAKIVATNLAKTFQGCQVKYGVAV